MWITQNNGEASVTFSESPGKPGPAMFLQNLSASTKAVSAVSPATKATALPLKLKTSGGMGSLSAPLPGGAAATATLLEGEGTWGVFNEIDPQNPPLLKYWFSAPTVTKPHDWFYIDGLSANRLGVSLRAAACDPATKAKTTKVVIVTRFDGKNLGGVNVTLFDASGAKLGEEKTTDAHGVATVELPVGAAAYAMASHVEAARGTWEGKAYHKIAHYATHSMEVACAKEAEEGPNPFPHQSKAAAAQTARWLVHSADWGTLSSLASSGAGANPSAVAATTASISDGAAGASTGRLWFYLMGGEGVEAGGDSWAAALTLSEAQVHSNTCESSYGKFDPEDPMCAKLTLSGTMQPATGADIAEGRAALFARHPQMKSWPASHGFTVYELVISDMWMIDFYGGAQAIAPTDYFNAKPNHNVPKWPPTTVEATAAVTAKAKAAAVDPPPWNATAQRARWLVYHGTWATVTTLSTRKETSGKAWGNVRSLADGVGKNSSGLPCLYLPTPDPTAVDVSKDPRVVLSLTEAALPERLSDKGVCGGARRPAHVRTHHHHDSLTASPLTTSRHGRRGPDVRADPPRRQARRAHDERVDRPGEGRPRRAPPARAVARRRRRAHGRRLLPPRFGGDPVPGLLRRAGNVAKLSVAEYLATDAPAAAAA